jgi:uncharacterized protein (DUF1778 family)
MMPFDTCTTSDFVLESALARADSVLAERQVFRVDAERPLKEIVRLVKT